MLGARRAAQALRRLSSIAVEVPGAPQPKVSDVTVSITLVNSLGERVRVPAHIGETLTKAAARFNYGDLRSPCEGTAKAVTHHKTAGGWDEPTFGEGTYCSHCLVILPEGTDAGMIQQDEADRLLDYPFRSDVGSSSRLGCRVEVTASMDGMVVYVPDGAEIEGR